MGLSFPVVCACAGAFPALQAKKRDRARIAIAEMARRSSNAAYSTREDQIFPMIFMLYIPALFPLLAHRV
ncbi:hypothetical protein [uncultured Cohaesibacter sp.]|uniref:hypothetical protein n=1 Tax=uncultured Cohaesibacter sp. TaxID=1002546 RepID=UPI00374A4FC9